MASRTSERSGAIAYIRVSTSRQELSPDAQRLAITQWGERRGIEILEWYEGIGERSQDSVEARPQLAAAIGAVQAQRAAWLVAARPDRFDRKAQVGEQIRAFTAVAGGRVATADGAEGASDEDDSPSGWLIRTMCATVREYEVIVLRFRTKEAMAVRRRAGKRIGSVPLGWQLAKACKCAPRCKPRGKAVCGLLVPNEAERGAGELAASLVSTHSLREIAARLAEAGHKPRGKAWHPNTVRRLLAAQEQDWTQ